MKARPAKPVFPDEEIFEYLKAGVQPIQLATSMGMTAKQLDDYCWDRFGCGYRDLTAQYHSLGEMEIMREQHRQAMSGSVKMLEFVGKNRLQQSDRVTLNISDDELLRRAARLVGPDIVKLLIEENLGAIDADAESGLAGYISQGDESREGEE